MESKAHQGTHLRTPDTWRRYQNARKRGAKECFICTAKPLPTTAEIAASTAPVDFSEAIVTREFLHWVIIPNQYPYDAVAQIHDMLCPKRHVAEYNELFEAEIIELSHIMRTIEESGDYDCTMTNFPVGQSHPSHMHHHLIRWRRHND